MSLKLIKFFTIFMGICILVLLPLIVIGVVNKINHPKRNPFYFFFSHSPKTIDKGNIVPQASSAPRTNQSEINTTLNFIGDEITLPANTICLESHYTDNEIIVKCDNTINKEISFLVFNLQTGKLKGTINLNSSP